MVGGQVSGCPVLDPHTHPGAQQSTDEGGQAEAAARQEGEEQQAELSATDQMRAEMEEREKDEVSGRRERGKGAR